MTSGLSPSLRKIQQDLLFGNTATAPTTCFIALHTGDPLGDGSAANELTSAGGYARLSFNFGSTNWNASTTPTGDAAAIVTNKVAMTFATSSGAYSGTASWWSMRLTSTIGDTTLGNFYARGQITPSQTITATGQAVVVPAGSASFTLAPS